MIAVNWDDFDAHSLILDLVKIGASPSEDTECEVYDAWTGSHIGNYKGKYYVVNPVEPHDNVALKIKCNPSS